MMMQQNCYTYLYKKIKYMIHTVLICSQYSDSLWDGRSGDRIPFAARFSAAVQTTPGAHLDSYTMGTRSFPRVKRPGHDVDHPPPYSAEVKERVELHFYSLSGSSWAVLG